MSNYTHLTQVERYHFSALLKSGKSIRVISKQLGRDKSTLYREVNRNKGLRGYRPHQAHEKALYRLKNSHRYIKITQKVIGKIERFLVRDWSPEQICGYLRERGLFVSHESIYHHILKDKKVGGNHKGALVTLVDRCSKKTRIVKIESKRSEAVFHAISKVLKSEIVHTITLDNGKEFLCHEKISKYTGCKVYFAHPYSSYERGLNENTNGLIRQYFPKKTDFRKITQKDVKRVEVLLNNRPRKSLGFLSPNEFHRQKMVC